MKKKFLFLAVAIACISALAFTRQKTTQQKEAVVSFWWNYDSYDPSGQYDPSNYYKDSDQLPDCPPSSGTIYCEIFAPASSFNSNEPDLSAISGSRMKTP